MKNRSALGAKLPHESAYLHVSGEARYVDDLPEPHGMLHAQILPSPWAHARILRKDATHARNVPGVHAVLFAEDLPAHNQVGPVIPDEPLLATDLVHCVGQAVAVVYAETPDQARAALAKIEVDYEPLESPCNWLERARIKRASASPTCFLPLGPSQVSPRVLPFRLLSIPKFNLTFKAHRRRWRESLAGLRA